MAAAAAAGGAAGGAALISPYSSGYFTFSVEINSNKLPKDSLKWGQLNMLLEKKRTCLLDTRSIVLPGPGFTDTTSDFFIYHHPQSTDRIRQLLEPSIQSGRFCDRLGPEYVYGSFERCDFSFNLSSRNPNGSSELNGFATVNYSEYGPDKAEPAFYIDIFCTDIQVSGAGLAMMNFLKSILMKEYVDDHQNLSAYGTPLQTQNTWYTIHLDSIQDHKTLDFYRKRHLVIGEERGGLIHHHWTASEHIDEIPMLEVSYWTNKNIPIFENKLEADDVMDWVGQGKRIKQKMHKRKRRLSKHSKKKRIL
jgi:hypothetical protein